MLVSKPSPCYDSSYINRIGIPLLMWFKQLQIFSLPGEWNADQLETQLEPFAFTPCLPHLFSSQGWVPPCGEGEFALLVQSIPGYHMVCCQFEEKILPASVIQQALHEKIKQMTEGKSTKKIPAKEKQQLKEAITQALLPRAFTKITRVYAYVDTKHQQFLINTTHTNKTEQLIGLFQRSIEGKLMALEHKKISPILTKWLINDKYPRDFFIGKACLLKDPQQQHRLIRCQEQALFSDSIQALLRERCEVKQLALSWQDQVHFILADDFTLKNLQFDDEVITAAKEAQCETEVMQFQADFVLMSGVLTTLIVSLTNVFRCNNTVAITSSSEAQLGGA